MTSESQIPTFVLRTLLEGATDPLVALSLEAMTRRPEGFLLIELAEALARGEVVEDTLPLVGRSPTLGGWTPGVPALDAALQRSLGNELMTERALRGWQQSGDPFRVLAAEYVQGRVEPSDVREVLIQAAGKDLPEVDVGPRPIGRFVHPGLYNWAMMHVDRFDGGPSSCTLLGLPFFTREEASGQSRLDEALTFPVTGSASLDWILKGFSNPWRQPCIQVVGLQEYALEPAMAACRFDPREERAEPGWHAVAMPKPAALEKDWFRLFGEDYSGQRAAVEELYPGWRIASVTEILTWAVLHRRLFGEWPVADLILRARRPKGVGGVLSNLNWVVHFSDAGSGPRIWVMSGHEMASKIGVALSRIPKTTSS